MTQQVLLSIPEPEFSAMIQAAVKEAIGATAPKQPISAPFPELLTRKEAAKYLGVSLPTLNSWSKRGIVLGYRIGSQVRYKRPEIETALQGMITRKSNGGGVK